jgi:hypothetical protein
MNWESLYLETLWYTFVSKLKPQEHYSKIVGLGERRERKPNPDSEDHLG